MRSVSGFVEVPPTHGIRPGLVIWARISQVSRVDCQTVLAQGFPLGSPRLLLGFPPLFLSWSPALLRLFDRYGCTLDTIATPRGSLRLLFAEDYDSTRRFLGLSSFQRARFSAVFPRNGNLIRTLLIARDIFVSVETLGNVRWKVEDTAFDLSRSNFNCNF